jgi:ABC-type Fe3+/spermidine/putrescine transport system ATPase subunit
MQSLPQAEIRQRVFGALEMVGMESFAERRVTDLSGGEQQRVALARALAPKPRLLMLDEPLGALDRGLREQLLEELRRILRQAGIPAIYVTHDQEEAFWIADRLLLLHDGRLVQAGKPSEVYEHPVSAWVARFFGLGNLVEGQVEGISPLRIRTTLGSFEPICSHPAGGSHRVGEKVTLLLRPSGARCIPDDTVEHVNQLRGKVTDVVYRGDGFRVDLEVNQVVLRFFLSPAPGVGDVLHLALEEQSVICLG